MAEPSTVWQQPFQICSGAHHKLACRKSLPQKRSYYQGLVDISKSYEVSSQQKLLGKLRIKPQGEKLECYFCPLDWYLLYTFVNHFDLYWLHSLPLASYHLLCLSLYVLDLIKFTVVSSNPDNKLSYVILSVLYVQQRCLLEKYQRQKTHIVANLNYFFDPLTRSLMLFFLWISDSIFLVSWEPKKAKTNESISEKRMILFRINEKSSRKKVPEKVLERKFPEKFSKNFWLTVA